MEVEKRGVKGSILQLFDWNGKSRKKLLSSKSELLETSNHGKQNYHASAIAQHQLDFEKGFPPNVTCHNDYRYDSSASGDLEYGTKPPGVVARLMGLDSLPTSNVNEPSCTPFTEAHSFRDSSYLMAPPVFQSEHDIVIFESARNKSDGLSKNPLDLRLQKLPNRPLERFRTEVLPSKSAKPSSIAHHRLLSPLKSPGFVPPKNAAYIIEAAAKFIEQSPRSTTRGNFPPLGSPSVPLGVRNLKEKMEAAHRSSRSGDASHKGKEEISNNTKKRLNARSKGQLEDSYLYKGPEESKRASSQRLKNKEKLVSPAVQAKANVHKKDGSSSVGNRSSEKQKEHNDVKTSSVTRVPRNTQKKVEKQSSSIRPSEVLRPNNQKQNFAAAKCEENVETSCSQPREKKESNLSTNYVNGHITRRVNKIVVNNVVTSRKTNFVAADPGKEVSSSRTTTSKKRLPTNGNRQSGGSVAQKAAAIKDDKSVKCNVAFEGDSKWEGIEQKNNLDVVSFTFTSPIKKSVGSHSRSRILEETSSSSLNFDPFARESELTTAASSSGSNAIGGDALGVLLEQKLRELTSRVEFSQKDISVLGSLSSSDNKYTMGTNVNLIKSPPSDNDMCKSKQEFLNASDCASMNKPWFQPEKESKGLEYFEGDGDNNSLTYEGYLHFQGSSSVSSQPSLSGASIDSFDIDRSLCTDGRSASLSLESYEGMNSTSIRKPHLAEDDVEISDNASSVSVGTLSESISSTLYSTDSKHFSTWELKYITEILSHEKLRWEEFSLGQAHLVIAPNLFDQLEREKIDMSKVIEEHALESKLLFDCVYECLEARFGPLLSCGCRFWAKQILVMNKRQWLVDDLYREISSLKNVEKLMEDELVEKDMGSKMGKWIDFEIEAFEEGIEVGNSVLTALVDELIDDLLL